MEHLLVGALWKRADGWCIVKYKIYYLQLLVLSSKDTRTEAKGSLTENWQPITDNY